MKAYWEDQDWWRVLFELNPLERKSFTALLRMLIRLHHVDIELPSPFNPVELSPDTLSELWYFQMKWGRTLIRHHETLTEAERQQVRLPSLPLTSEAVENYLKAYQQIVRSRDWYTACLMSVLSIFRVNQLELDQAWHYLWNSRLSVHLHELSVVEGIPSFLHLLQRIEVIGPQKGLPERLQSFLETLGDDFESCELPTALGWIHQRIKPHVIQAQTIEASKPPQEDVMDVLSNTNWSNAQSVDSTVDFLSQNFDTIFNQFGGQTQQRQKVTVIQNGKKTEYFSQN